MEAIAGIDVAVWDVKAFPADLHAYEAAREALREIADKVWRYCEGSGVRGRTVTLKVKFANFQRVTRRRTGHAPVGSRNALEEIGGSLLESLFPIERGIRLLGISFSSLESEEANPKPSSTYRSESLSAPAERRQLTVMFCDLVGSTALSRRLDTEDLREVIGAYHRCVAETIGRFAEFVAKYMGYGLLVYFGYPQAHKDDAEMGWCALDLPSSRRSAGSPRPKH
jgi:hypothetical protein